MFGLTVYQEGMDITPQALRTARAILGLSGQELAREAGLSLAAIRGFEGGKSALMAANRREIVRYLESRGVAIVETPDGRISVSAPRRDTSKGGGDDL